MNSRTSCTCVHPLNPFVTSFVTMQLTMWRRHIVLVVLGVLCFLELTSGLAINARAKRDVDCPITVLNAFKNILLLLLQYDNTIILLYMRSLHRVFLVAC